jgi:hypothetical protein
VQARASARRADLGPGTALDSRRLRPRSRARANGAKRSAEIGPARGYIAKVKQYLKEKIWLQRHFRQTG